MAKFKVSNIDTWDASQQPSGPTARFAASSTKEAAQRMLDQIDQDRKSVEDRYTQTENRFSSKQTPQYDFEAQMKATKRSGTESDFSEVRSEDDYEQMSPYASNSRSIKRSGYEMAEDAGPVNLAMKYFHSAGGAVLPDPRLLEEILVEKENKRQLIYAAKEQKDLLAKSRMAEMEEMRQHKSAEMFDEGEAFEGLTFSDLSKNKVRKIGHDTVSASKFGLLNQEQIERREKLLQQSQVAKEERSGKIKRAAVSEEERRSAWEDYEGQRSHSVQDRFNNSSPTLGNLSKLMR